MNIDKGREEAEKIFGKKCFFCGKTKTNKKDFWKIQYHSKNGIRHESSCTAAMALKNPEGWIRLCVSCHKGVHWCMQFFGMSWEDIVKKFKGR